MAFPTAFSHTHSITRGCRQLFSFVSCIHTLSHEDAGAVIFLSQAQHKKPECLSEEGASASESTCSSVTAKGFGLGNSLWGAGHCQSGDPRMKLCWTWTSSPRGIGSRPRTAHPELILTQVVRGCSALFSTWLSLNGCLRKTDAVNLPCGCVYHVMPTA